MYIMYNILMCVYIYIYIYIYIYKVPPAESWRLGQFFFARLPVDPPADEP